MISKKFQEDKEQFDFEVKQREERLVNIRTNRDNDKIHAYSSDEFAIEDEVYNEHMKYWDNYYQDREEALTSWCLDPYEIKEGSGIDFKLLDIFVREPNMETFESMFVNVGHQKKPQLRLKFVKNKSPTFQVYVLTFILFFVHQHKDIF